MTDEEKFQHVVNSVRFDDEPRSEHRDRLEQELLAEYDAAEPMRYEPEPTMLYLRKLAVAAGFLIVCGTLFYTIDHFWLQNPDLTYQPNEQIVKRIFEAENPTDAEKPNLMAQINQVWQMILKKDTHGLTCTLMSKDKAPSVRNWAAENLGRIGNKETLETLEDTIEQEQVTDPDDPLNIAADDIRQRLDQQPED